MLIFCIYFHFIQENGLKRFLKIYYEHSNMDLYSQKNLNKHMLKLFKKVIKNILYKNISIYFRFKINYSAILILIKNIQNKKINALYSLRFSM